MRSLDQCKAEIFRQSEEKIQNRKVARKRLLACCIPIVLCWVVWSVSLLPAMLPAGKDRAPEEGCPENQKEYDMEAAAGNAVAGWLPHQSPEAAQDPQGFFFSLTWGCYGESSYDSGTGRLVKTNNATHPEAYVTTCHLTAAQWSRVWELVSGLDMESYPDTYDPHSGVMSKPSMTLILTVRTNTSEKTITAKNIALSYETDNEKGQAFLDVCRQIQQILSATEEWKALPDYEFYYD